jgi:hypothetical protein
MNGLSDQELLRDYAEGRSEVAFAELVRRHVGMVYSAAVSMVCDPHLAQDVSQMTIDGRKFIGASKNKPKNKPS